MLGRTTWSPTGVIVWLVIGGGSAVSAHSLYTSLQIEDTRWLLLALGTAFSSLLPVPIPSMRKSGRGRSPALIFTPSGVFILTAILAFGPAVAALLSLIDGGLSGWRFGRTRKPWRERLLGIFQFPLVAFLSAHFFYFVYGDPAPLSPDGLHPLGPLFLALLLATVLSASLNAAMLSLATQLDRPRPLREIWVPNLTASYLSSITEVPAALLIFLNLNHAAVMALAIAGPTVILIYFSQRVHSKLLRVAQKQIENGYRIYRALLESIAMAIDSKDQVEPGHVHRVRAMALGLAHLCGLSNRSDLEGLETAALLHDLGKLATPDSVLNKSGRLTKAEQERVRAHPQIGAEILSSVPFPFPVVPFVKHQREQWDGSGHPEGLAGEEIPLGARILSLVDCYDALRSERPYRSSMSRDEAIAHVISESGRRFDPTMVRTLVDHIDELEEVSSSSLHSAPSLPPSPAIASGTSVFHNIATAHREVQTLHELSLAAGQLMDVGELVELMVSRLSRLVPFALCIVYLVNTRKWLVPAHARGKCSSWVHQLKIPLTKGVSGWVAASRKPCINVSPEPDWENCPHLGAQFKSCMSVPLSTDRETVCVVTLYSEDDNGFTQHHLRVTQSVADHASAAIANAVIFEETRESAFTDALTGLPNLRYLNTFVPQDIQRSGLSEQPLSIVMMDLDSFKKVNDSLGHPAGDVVLKQVARLLRRQMRKSDICIRYGGDEFVAVLPGVTPEARDRIVLQLQEAVAEQPFDAPDGSTVHCGLSLGAATFPEDGKSLDQLLVAADRDMYQNKMSRAR